jgi:hypothetical protein
MIGIARAVCAREKVAHHPSHRDSQKRAVARSGEKEEQRGRKVARKSPPTGAPRFPCGSLTGHWSLNFQSVVACSRTFSSLSATPYPDFPRLQLFLNLSSPEDLVPPPCGDGLSHSSVNRLPATRCPSSRLSANWRATTMNSPGSMALGERGLGCRRCGHNPVHDGLVNR